MINIAIYFQSVFLGILNKIAKMSHIPFYNLTFHLHLSFFSFQYCTFSSNFFFF